MTKQCLYCGLPFTPRSNKSIYCSNECRNKAFRAKHSQPIPSPITAHNDYQWLIDSFTTAQQQHPNTDLKAIIIKRLDNFSILGR